MLQTYCLLNEQLRHAETKIIDTYVSKNYSSREGNDPEVLILHYTNLPLTATLGIFTNNAELIEEPEFKKFSKQKTSAHLTIDEEGTIYPHVAPENAAHHAGNSYWEHKEDLNKYAIGIEHVNLGENWHPSYSMEGRENVTGSNEINIPYKSNKDPLMWQPFSEPQINTSIALCKAIIAQFNISPFNVLAHSDVAPGRKFDPGPLFPWQKLAEQGVGVWYDLTSPRKFSDLSTAKGKKESIDIPWVQKKLKEYGYKCRQTKKFDLQTKQVVQAFQMHFRPENISGVIDRETMEILDALCSMKKEHNADAGEPRGGE